MATIPTKEPASVTAGDTLVWIKSLVDYAASAGWTLKYRLINTTAKIDIIAAAAGADHSVTVTAATSAAYVAGWYDWQAFVEKGAERYTIGSGRMQILPNLAGVAAAGFDDRSQARKVLELLMAAYESAVTSRAFVQEYQISGRQMKFSNKADWLLEINFWQAQVAQEERAARINAGLGAGNKLLVRFK